MRKTVCAVLLAAAVAGCGGGEKAATSTAAPRAADSVRVWDESQVLQLAGIEPVDDGLSYRLAAHPELHGRGGHDDRGGSADLRVGGGHGRPRRR